MPEPILQLEQLHKHFGSTVVADQLNLTIYKGEFFTLLGPSGSGKSTVLRIVAGLDQPDQGRVMIEGKDMGSTAPWQRGLGVVFQQYALFPHLSVAQNVQYGLRVRRIAKTQAMRKVSDLLKLVGLAGFENKSVTVLSGGEKQRVALARALAIEPALLLLDEPLSALDEKVRREMQGELKRIHRETGTAFVYVTHDQEEALTMSDRIAVLHKGKLEQCDAPEIVFRKPRTRFVAGFFRGCNVLEVAAEPVGQGRVKLSIGDRKITVPGSSTNNPVHIALRAENIRVGTTAQSCQIRLAATRLDTTYRGTNLDHILELQNGQRLIATAIHHQTSDADSQVDIGFNVEDVVLLED